MTLSPKSSALTFNSWHAEPAANSSLKQCSRLTPSRYSSVRVALQSWIKLQRSFHRLLSNALDQSSCFEEKRCNPFTCSQAQDLVT